MKYIKKIKNIIYGVIIGASMLLPGVSGGTMAIMLGVYDRLISSVSGIFKDFKRNSLFLLQVAGGAVFGMLLFSKAALFIVETFPFPAHFFFIGAVTGTVPVLFKKTKAENGFGIRDAICIAIGFGLLFLLTLVPSGLFDVQGNIGFPEFMLLLFGGFCISIALVLPGISASYTLLLLGIYDRFLKSLSDLDVMFLFPMGLGLVLGTFLVSKTLEKAMTRFTRQTYMIIAGFVLASVLELFPGIPYDYMLALCVGAFTGGFLLTFLLGKKA